MSNTLNALQKQLGPGTAQKSRDPRVTGLHKWPCGCWAQSVGRNPRWSMIATCEQHRETPGL
ncbi:MAG TPA: hypothetical protein VIG32_05145 [Candidatus Baltobacteraceae bacterium]|jgi:hypothetical protein